MRTFEFLIPLTLAIYLLWPLFSGKENPFLVNFLSVVAVVEVVAHLLFEGYRWQMIPIYILVGMFLLTTVSELRQPIIGEYERKSWSTIGMIGIFIILLGSTILLVLLPVPTIPMPNGKYEVGIQTFELTDESRLELYSENNDEPRKFIITVWYPAKPEPEGKRAPWMDHAAYYGRAIAKAFGFPAFVLDHLSLIKSPAWQDAPVNPSRDGYPVIFFSHAWKGIAAQNTGQVVELVSNGFVVVAIQHTYGSAATVFPDGEIVYYNPSSFPGDVPEPEYTLSAQKLASQWAEDISFSLDFMIDQNQNPVSSFYTTLNTTDIGVFGHSAGGAAAIQFCNTDPRCSAVLAMDPLMVSVSRQVLNTGLSQNALFMFSQEWIEDIGSRNNRTFKQFFEKTGSLSHVIEILGTIHSDFTDLPLLSPFAHQLGLKGSINRDRLNEIINSYTYIFFYQTLENPTFDLYSGLSPEPEVVRLDNLRKLVYPRRIVLPGGQEFNLGEGDIRNDKWVPLSAEWLSGTEISRWVALPWSSELEEVIKGIEPGDQIELTMSNSDVVMFQVYSIQRMTMNELMSSEATKPSLLVMLYDDQNKDEAYWVITAFP